MSPTQTISRCGGTATLTYYQTVAGFASTYTLVAQWHLTEGATPYADTSGYSATDPATMVRQVRVVAMTQNYASGPLLDFPAGPSVAFNFDGTSLTNTGDFLVESDITPSRFYFAGNLPFTVIAWVLPGAGVNTHEGPIVSVVHVTGFGAPGAHDDGWMMDVSQPDLLPKFRRYSNVQSGGSPDEAVGSALSTSQWTMLAGVYDGTNVNLYVNGAFVSGAASAGAIGGSANNARIGLGTIDQGNTSTWYFGAAAEITVWAATLPANVINALYQAGIS